MESQLPSTPFIGRHTELKAIRMHLEASMHGEGSVVSIFGEGGIGKTRLAAESVRLAQQVGLQAVWGRALESEECPAFGIWRSVARSLKVEIDGGNSDCVSILLDGIEESLAPSLLVLDNVQWADSASLSVLHKLLGIIDGLRLVVIITYRPEEMPRRPELQRIVSEITRIPAADTFMLSNFDAEESKNLAIALTPEIQPQTIDDIHKRSDGNPLFVTELVRSLAFSPEGSDRAVPISLGSVINARLQNLNEKAREILRAASVCGRTFRRSEVVHASGGSISEVLNAIENGIFIGLVTTNNRHLSDDAEYMFTHALFQGHLEQTMPPKQRAKIHEKLAEFLAAKSGAKSTDVIRHLAAALPEIDPERLVTSAQEACDEAQRKGAAEVVSDLADLVVVALSSSERTEKRDRWIARFLHAKACSLLYSHHLDLGRRVLKKAADLYESIGDIGAMVEVALADVPRFIVPLSKRRFYQRESDLIRRVISKTDPGSVHEAWLRIHLTDDISTIENVIEMAMEWGNKELEMEARSVKIGRLGGHTAYKDGIAHFRNVWYTELEKELDQIVELSTTADNDRALFWAMFRRAGHHQLHWDHRRIDRDTRLIASAGNRMGVRHIYIERLMCDSYRQGDWDRAFALASEHRRYIHDTYDSYPLGNRLIRLAIIEYERGLIHQGDKHAKLLRSLTAQPDVRYAVVQIFRASITGRADCAEKAFEIVESGIDAESIRTVIYWLGGFCVACYIDWVLIKKNEEMARISLNRWNLDSKSYFAPVDDHWNPLLQKARLLELVGQRSQAATAYETAIDALRKALMRPLLSKALYYYASMISGDASKSSYFHEMIDEALELATEIGMVFHRDRILQLKRRMKQVDDRHPGEPKREITRREFQILVSVSRGYTNKEVAGQLNISKYTVARHLQNIYEKTGMANRTELTAYALKHGLID